MVSTKKERISALFDFWDHWEGLEVCSAPEFGIFLAMDDDGLVVGKLEASREVVFLIAGVGAEFYEELGSGGCVLCGDVLDGLGVKEEFEIRSLFGVEVVEFDPDFGAVVDDFPFAGDGVAFLGPGSGSEFFFFGQSVASEGEEGE